MNIAMHAADVSPPTRRFDLTRKWTYLLFDEFFDQGDREKIEELPITMLCDRTTTSVSGCQPGFLNFIVIPLFTNIVKVMPNMRETLERGQSNVQNW